MMGNQNLSYILLVSLNSLSFLGQAALSKYFLLLFGLYLLFVFSSKNDTMWQQKRTLKVCLFSLLSNSIQYVFLFFLLNSVVFF
jgi:hypothetical protein